jgi:hypothetical protein
MWDMYRQRTQPIVVRQQLERPQEIVRRDLPQAIHDLEQPYDTERRARPWISSGRWPPADPHELLAVLDIPIAVAEVDVDVVDAGHIDDHEVRVCPEGTIAAEAWRVTQLHDQAQVFERPPHKEIPIPFLRIFH